MSFTNLEDQKLTDAERYEVEILENKGWTLEKIDESDSLMEVLVFMPTRKHYEGHPTSVTAHPILIKHLSEDRIKEYITGWMPVARMKVRTLEEAYQNMQQDQCNVNDYIEGDVIYNNRSMAVGDRIICEGKTYQADGVGFSEMPMLQLEDMDDNPEMGLYIDLSIAHMLDDIQRDVLLVKELMFDDERTQIYSDIGTVSYASSLFHLCMVEDEITNLIAGQDLNIGERLVLMDGKMQVISDLEYLAKIDGLPRIGIPGLDWDIDRMRTLPMQGIASFLMFVMFTCMDFAAYASDRGGRAWDDEGTGGAWWLWLLLIAYFFGKASE